MTAEVTPEVAEWFTKFKMKFFHLINYNSLIICIGLLILSLMLFSFFYRSKPLIFITVTSIILGVIFISSYKLQDNSADQKYINDVIASNQHTLVYLYSNFWAACVAYKPQVLKLKTELNESIITFIDYEISTKQAKDFIEKYNHKSVPHVMLLDNNGTLIDKWQFIPNLDQINQSISK